MNHLEPDLSSTSLSRNASFMQNSSTHTILSFLLFYSLVLSGTFSTSLLRFSLYSSLSPNSVSFLFSNVLNSLPGKLRISVFLFVFSRGFSLRSVPSFHLG